jgi:osmotically inducible protein OsmC
MALSASIAKTGHAPTSVTTTARVQLEKGESGSSITRIDLVTRGVVPGLAEADFLRLAEETRTGCIVSRALAAVPTTLDARLGT